MFARLKTGLRILGERGPYRITNKVGGLAWRAKTPHSNVIIKLKPYVDSFSNERYALEKFKGEASIRQIIAYFDPKDKDQNRWDYEHDDLAAKQAQNKVPFLVLEHLDENMATISQEKALNTAELKTVSRSVLKALACAHKEEIINMDVQPNNVLANRSANELSRFREVKLSDFSFMIMADNNCGYRSQRKWFGPPPQNFEAYSGVTVYAADPHLRNIAIEALDEESSTPGESPDQMMDRSFDETYRDRISEADRAFMKRMMKMNPEERPTAEELLEHEWLDEGDKGSSWLQLPDLISVLSFEE